MRLHYHRNFTKRASKLLPAQKKRLARALRLFGKNPHHPEFYNHPLKGRWKGHRSISFGGDWRAHYIEKGKDVVLFVVLGRHPELYGE